MGRKVLVALDGSDGSLRALDVAVDYAKITQSELVLTYIIDWTPYSFHTPQELEERHNRRESEINRAHDSVLQPQIVALENSGLSIETVVRHGKIPETLSRLAIEYKAHQIYVGRQGESSIRTMIFGSVIAALIQTATTPVVVVP